MSTGNVRNVDAVLYKMPLSALLHWKTPFLRTYGSNAMVTNHLRARTVSISQKKSYDSTAHVRRPAGGRKNRTIFLSFLDIVRCPVKFRYYLKFNGVRTAFGRVKEGKMTFVHIGRAPDDFCLQFISYDSRPGNVRCLLSAGNFQISLNESADARPGTGRCPSRHRPMFYESNRHR